MVVLDTNVVSETMKSEPDLSVRTWLNNQVAETLYLASVTVAELLFGIAALPEDKRRDRLEESVDGLMVLFRNRMVSFDIDAARRYAELAVTAKTRGRNFPVADGYIAAIAASRGFIVASRDTAPFEAAGLSVINPW
jgi:predicted nucleic acid-binding protein